MACLFFFSGYQVVYSVFDNGAVYKIVYGINSVSYASGQKYQHNKTTVVDRQMWFLSSVIAKVTGRIDRNPFDYRSLEYY